MSFVARSAAMAVLIATSASPCAAQGLEFGVKGGVGMSTVSNVSEITETSDAEAGRQFGPVFGGFVGISLSGSRLSIQPEALLTWKGATLDDDGDGETLRMRYLDVPLLVKLTAPSGGDEKALYVLGGLNLGFALGADVHADGADHDISDRIKSTDFGLTVGAGLQARRWLVEGRYTEGLVNIAVDDSDDPVQTRTFAVLVGIRF